MGSQAQDQSRIFNRMGLMMKFLKYSFLWAVVLQIPLSFAEYVPQATYLKYAEHYKVNKDGSSEQIMEVLLRIDTENGVSKLGEQKVSFNSSLESVEVLDAYTVQPNGEKIKVELDKIRTQDEYSDTGSNIYSEAKQKVIIFPKVEKGSQLYYKTHSHQHTPDFEGQFFVSALFYPQYKYEHVEISLEYDPLIELKVDMKGFSEDTKVTLEPSSPGFTKRSFHYSQMTAYPTESGTVNLLDYAPFLAISSFKSYAQVGLDYQKRALPKAEVTPEIEQLAKELTKDKVSDKEKVRALYNWVSRNIRYIGIYAGVGGYVPHEASSILKNQYGDCKDHVTLLEAMLKAVGIFSSPALINASNAYKLPKLPSPIVFDHVITYVPSLKLFLDSTAQFAPLGVLPDDDLNKSVVIASTGEVLKTKAASPDIEFTISKTKMDLMPDGGVLGSNVSTMRGYHEIESRAFQFGNLNKDQPRIVNRLLSRFQETGVGKIEVSEPNDLDRPWQVKSIFELDPIVNVPGPSAMTLPVGVSPGKLKGMSTYKPPSVRRFPVVCSSGKYIEMVELRFPKDMKIERIPVNASFKKGSLNYKSSYELKGRILYAYRELVANRGDRVCDSKDDAEWMAFSAVLNRDLRQQVFFN